MQNCYNTNARVGAGAQQEKEEAEAIEERLSRRHLETLQFAQELARQNRELKEATQKLEARLVECEPAHRMADEAQQRLLEMQERCNQRVDEVARRLVEQHEREMAAVLQDRADDERAWYAARQREQTELLKMQMALRDQEELAAKLEARIGELGEALAAEAKKSATMDTAVAAATAERDSARRALATSEARQRNGQLARTELDAERQKCAELQLRLEQLVRDRHADSQAEAEHQRCLEDCHRQLGSLRFETEKTEHRLADAERLLTEERRTAERLEVENAALRADVVALRAQLQTANATVAASASPAQRSVKMAQQLQQQPPTQPSHQQVQHGDTNFREFVAVKRELSALREENERLRGRLRTAAASSGASGHGSTVSAGRKT